MSDQNPFRTEIEDILRAHTRTRYTKVFLGMERGLNDDQMADEAGVIPERISTVRKAVRMTLDDELATGKTWANWQAGLYRELRNCPMSPELRQHVATRLAQLQQIDPSISSEPLGNIRLGRNEQPSPPKPEPRCPNCFMVHAGECP